ncbi:MAG TPA: serine hydrolase [Candidatus Limnocylindrales bacterium]|jgi:CubicO group peptidase (beta-lactamase class C family)
MPQASQAGRRRALEPVFDLARAQVGSGLVPFVILGVAGSDGVTRLEAMSSPDAPRVGSDGVCLLASITKPIVATAVLQQVEAGRVELAGDVGAWAPDLVNPDWAPVTPWHLLSHTSGIDDLDLEAVMRDGGGRPEVLRRLAQAGQLTLPGTRYHYASAPYDLLAEGVARRTGEPFEALLRRTLLAPLGMSSTTFDPRPDPALASRMASIGVGAFDGHPFGADPPSVDAFTDLHLCGGGLWSSASDLLRFGRAMLRGGELDGVRILSPAMLALMTREVTAPVGAASGIGWNADPLQADHYALGWGTPRADTVASPRAFGHGGASGTRLWIDPQYDLVYVYLTGSWGLPTALIDAVQAAIYAAVS